MTMLDERVPTELVPAPRTEEESIVAATSAVEARSPQETSYVYEIGKAAMTCANHYDEELPFNQHVGFAD